MANFFLQKKHAFNTNSITTNPASYTANSAIPTMATAAANREAYVTLLVVVITFTPSNITFINVVVVVICRYYFFHIIMDEWEAKLRR